jgi:hypothetical protein
MSSTFCALVHYAAAAVAEAPVHYAAADAVDAIDAADVSV